MSRADRIKDRAVEEGPGPFQRLLAVHVRQAQIEKITASGGWAAMSLQARTRVVGPLRFIAGRLQRGAQEPVDLRLVIDDQNARAMGGHGADLYSNM